MAFGAHWSVPIIGTFGSLRLQGSLAMLRLLVRTTAKPIRGGPDGQWTEAHHPPDAAIIQQLASQPAEGEEDEPAPAGAAVGRGSLHDLAAHQGRPHAIAGN